MFCLITDSVSASSNRTRYGVSVWTGDEIKHSLVNYRRSREISIRKEPVPNASMTDCSIIMSIWEDECVTLSNEGMTLPIDFASVVTFLPRAAAHDTSRRSRIRTIF
jgi:hypothetical protein